MPRFIITFGQGDDLRRNCYTEIDAADKTQAVELGYQLYGNHWSQAYLEDEGAAIIAEWGLTYIAPGS